MQNISFTMNSEYFSKGVKHLKMRVAGPAAQREAYGAALGEAGAGEDRHPGQRDARKLGGGAASTSSHRRPVFLPFSLLALLQTPSPTGFSGDGGQDGLITVGGTWDQRGA